MDFVNILCEIFSFWKVGNMLFCQLMFYFCIEVNLRTQLACITVRRGGGKILPFQLSVKKSSNS